MKIDTQAITRDMKLKEQMGTHRQTFQTLFQSAGT
jgi:hypothetical protein